VGILGQQALPTVITMLVFWPVLVTQIWGAVKASKVDDEALSVVEAGLAQTEPAAEIAPTAPHVPASGAFCASCGAAHSGGRFCTNCGSPL
jgi:hypothetical protein